MNGTYHYKISFLIANCISGEIYDNFVYFCNECPLGKYSFNPLDLECQVCPNEAWSCSKNIIDLKNGFWISDYSNLKIHKCQPYENSCL